MVILQVLYLIIIPMSFVGIFIYILFIKNNQFLHEKDYLLLNLSFLFYLIL